jgi:hypothetical protein
VVTETPQQPVEHGSGGWLKARRHRIALWIAAGEGVLVLLSHDLTKWTVVALGAIAAVAWLLGRNTHSEGLRQGLWIFLVSQLLAVILVLFAVFFKWLLILGLIACAVVALAFLFLDRR